MNQDQKIDLLFNEREILNLINRFDQATNLRDTTLFASLWTEDAVWEISKPIPSKAHGRANIIAMLGKLYEPLDFFFRTTQSPTIEFQNNGLSASGRAGTMELARMSDGKSYANVAFYSDEYRKGKDGWQFSGRHYEYIWVETELPLPGSALTRRKD